MSKPTNFTYSNNLISTRQPIVQRAGFTTGKYENNNIPKVTSGIVAGMSRPNVNLGNSPMTSSATNESNAEAFVGKNANANRRRANPIKHWRRQLHVNGNSGTSATSISVMERPGGSVFRGYTTDSSGCLCLKDGNNLYITFDSKYLQSTSMTVKPAAKSPIIAGTNNNKLLNNGFIQVGTPDVSGSYQIQTGIYNTKAMCCSEEKKSRNRTRSYTNISRSYYSDTKAYLKARCNTFEQKQSIHKISNNTYNSKTISENSTQFNTNNCTNPYQTGRSCDNVTYYNPSNTQFSTQGAVESSTRLLKLNYNTITKNGAAFNSAKANQYATAGKYRGESASTYFVKDKYTLPIRWSRNGKKGPLSSTKLCNSKCVGKGQTLGGFWGSTIN